MKRSGRIRAVTDRRRDERAERRAVVAAAMDRDRRLGGCRARIAGAPGRCSTELVVAMDPHEVIPRSAWATGYLALDNVVMVCRAHHDWIGDHPNAAHALGLHGFSWERDR